MFAGPGIIEDSSGAVQLQTPLVTSLKKRKEIGGEKQETVSQDVLKATMTELLPQRKDSQKILKALNTKRQI